MSDLKKIVVTDRSPSGATLELNGNAVYVNGYTLRQLEHVLGKLRVECGHELPEHEGAEVVGI